MRRAAALRRAARVGHRGLFAERMRRALDARARNGTLRATAPQPPLADFSSNDYLGLARDRDLARGPRRLFERGFSD